MNRKLSTDALNRPSVDDYKNQEKFPIKLLLDDIRSLSNVGSLFRTADSFNVEEILLCGITGKPPHRDIQKTALGATESVLWSCNENALETVLRLKADGYKIVSLEQCEQSVDPRNFDLEFNAKVCLIVGNEVNGVDQSIIDISDMVMEIPQMGTKHSLNVTVAGGIALWEIIKKYLKE
jgi:23S rRNA (guanosine2251-2'-O)-methyltransferase